MCIPKPDVTLSEALKGVESGFRARTLKSYLGLKKANGEHNLDACGLRAGRFCEVLIRWLQQELTGTHIPFGTKIANFKEECARLEATPTTSGHESMRVVIPRALNFLYTLRNKRGIGHEGGDVDANAIDAVTAVRIADWCICELVRLKYAISLEEAQAICDAVAERQVPDIWEVFGKRRVLKSGLSYPEQTLLLLYSAPESAVPVEDLIEWTEYSNPVLYRRDVLRRLHRSRLIEYDEDLEVVTISPRGVSRVESEILKSDGRAG